MFLEFKLQEASMVDAVFGMTTFGYSIQSEFLDPSELLLLADSRLKRRAALGRKKSAVTSGYRLKAAYAFRNKLAIANQA
jgi:hypothetical protein